MTPKPIDALLKKAVDDFAALSPVDQALMKADQRRSWVRGQIGRDPGEDVLAAEVRRLREALRVASIPPTEDAGRIGDVLADLERDLRRRQAACKGLAKKADVADLSRLEGKAAAYQQSADLVAKERLLIDGLSKEGGRG